MSKRDELIQALGAAIQADEGLAPGDCRHLVLVFRAEGTQSSLQAVCFQADGSYGYKVAKRHDQQGAQGVLETLRDEMAKTEKEPWGACLVRVDGESGELDLEFEYDDPDRWDYAKTTQEAWLDTLRPKG